MKLLGAEVTFSPGLDLAQFFKLGFLIKPWHKDPYESIRISWNVSQGFWRLLTLVLSQVYMTILSKNFIDESSVLFQRCLYIHSYFELCRFFYLHDPDWKIMSDQPKSNGWSNRLCKHQGICSFRQWLVRLQIISDSSVVSTYESCTFLLVISISEGHEWDVRYSWNFLKPKETFLFFRDVLFSSVLIRGCVETPGWYLRIFSSNTFLLCWMVLRKLPTYSHLLATRQIQAKFFDAMNLLVRMVSVCSQQCLLRKDVYGYATIKQAGSAQSHPHRRRWFLGF